MINKTRQLMAGKSNEQLSVDACIAAGMKVGSNVYGLINCTIDYGSCWLIEIGDNVMFGPEVYLLSHDTSTKRFVNYTRVGKIIIGRNVFVGARVFIMPNVTIGENSIIGSCSVVTRDVPPNVVVAGNPARVITTVEAYRKKIEEEFERSPKFDSSYTLPGGITPDKVRQMNEEIIENGYVR
ncbi:MAG: hypothetical protein BGO09_12265 [Bacteroidetes bacterium 47-18]|nr:MAG: hypothetical protein BGO09_12265 [Bacteroidetes bacterium 47-18]